MAATAADSLEIRHHDDHVSRYEQVTYCAWAGGVTVYRNGAEIARHDDVLTTQALKLVSGRSLTSIGDDPQRTSPTWPIAR